MNNDLIAKYKTLGLTYKSNDINITARDAAGNIHLTPNNTLVVIEPINTFIKLDSAVRAVDTQFNYYTFPVSIETDAADLLLDIDLNQADFVDTISTRYIIPYQEYPDGVPNSYRRINTSYSSTWFTNGGEALAGFLPLPFTGGNQPKPYSFTLTPDMIDTLKSSNKTIKFYIQAQFAPADQLINIAFRMRLRRTNADANLYRNSTVIAELKTETKGEYNSGNYPLLTMEYILNINDIYEYDTFVVEVVSGNPSWCLGDNAIWNIDLIDNPTVYPNYGIQSISNNTDLIIGTDVIIDGRD